jgi:nucleotide-binding universal stress UspA family protein
MTVAKSAATEPLLRIVHPSDFSRSSQIAFVHALKIALLSQAELEIIHVQEHELGKEEDVRWTDFPGVRATLANWKVVPANASREDVEKTGMRARKILNADADPLEAMVRYCEEHPPDLLVLATYQREGLSRWLHRAVAEPLARRSRAMTLFVPGHGQGFIAPADGAVKLEKILIPVDHAPDGQAAVEEAFFLADGLGCGDVDFKLLHVGTEGMPTLFLPHHPGYRWKERLVDGEVAEAIEREAAMWQPDLMVFTTAGHRDFLGALRGSTTERVLRAAHCPVLAVPAKPVSSADSDREIAKI